jgi:hypothetical protein
MQKNFGTISKRQESKKFLGTRVISRHAARKAGGKKWSSPSSLTLMYVDRVRVRVKDKG